VDREARISSTGRSFVCHDMGLSAYYACDFDRRWLVDTDGVSQGLSMEGIEPI
jgi:hypothetical protein